jgi:uncharacterized membrane protein YeaQ/YmgE (transglycosylase-associated protein family)
MLGMNFVSFVVLLVIAAVVAAIFEYVLQYRFLGGVDSLVAKIAIGWLGAWLGSPVLGHWWIKVENVYLVPAILGAGAAIFFGVAWWKAVAKACGGRAG